MSMERKIYVDCGATDGESLCTAAVQTLIDKLHADGGGTVVFPTGKYVLSTVFLRSNVHILLDGAEILGSLQFEDYCKDEQVNYPLYQDASHSFFHCSMFVGEGCENISVTGNGKIDMRSVWDEKNVRNMGHRGAKCIALKGCKGVRIEGISVYNATDLAIYFAGCTDVKITDVKVRAYIDGISPDASKRVLIDNCEVESGDDGIVFKSSYTLNRLESCEDITVSNCKIKSRCNAIKFGTETNGDFKNIHICDCLVYETRLAGIAVESVDGAHIDGLYFYNIQMQNVGTPIFVHLGKRLRGPKGTKVGSIKNISFDRICANGPYVPYKAIAWNYDSFINKDEVQEPWHIGKAEGFNDDGEEITAESGWQISSNVCGLRDNPLRNISFKNVQLEMNGGVDAYKREVSESPLLSYPEVYCYGRILPASGIYFRFIEGLTLENVRITTLRKDVRETIIID